MHKTILLTSDGLEELKKEYEELKNVKRPAAVKRLAAAKAQGDLSENSEYTASMDELAFIDGRISELEEILLHAKAVKSMKSAGSEVQIGCQVAVQINGKQEEFYIVGEWEADPQQRKISHNSPLGKALIGKKKGDEIEVEAPVGKVSYKILAVK